MNMSGVNSRFRDQYKRNILVSEGGGKYKRAKKKLEDRRISRIEHFSRQRNLTGLMDDSETVRTAVDSRKLRLQKWKEEKLQKKLLMKASEKPAFKCGIVHHRLGSPYFTDISNVSYIKKVPTLARLGQKTVVAKKNHFPDTKQSFAPSDFKFKPPKIKSAVLIEEESRVVSDRKKGVSSIQNECTIQLQENPLRRVTRAQTRACGTRVQYNFTSVPKASNKQKQKSPQILQGIGSSKIVLEAPVIKKNSTEESTTLVSTEVVRGSDIPEPDIEAERPVVENVNTEERTGPTIREVVERCDTPKAEAAPCTPVQAQWYPINYSPFVTKGRGSSSKRSHCVSEKSPRDDSAISCERDKLGSPVLCSNAVDTAEENRQHGILYFRSVLENETERLQTICQEWLHIQCSVSDIPPETSDLINAAVGQTQLLLKKKFSQFCGLIDTCENVLKLGTTAAAAASVTCSDLDGFWDMVYMQVEDVDLRFSKLEKLKLNNWKEDMDVCENVKQPVARRLRKVPVKKPQKSSLHSMIAAARKRKQTEASESKGFVSLNAPCTPERVAKTRTGSTPLLSRRSKTSLLQHTLEEHKRNSRGLNRESSPIIMKVTQIAKMCDAGIMPTVQVLETSDAPSPLRISSANQKPRKSILKSVTCNLPLPLNTVLSNDESVIGDSIMTIQPSSVETKDNEVFKLRRSSRSITRKVRFEGKREIRFLYIYRDKENFKRKQTTYFF
ncbi:disks large-associated protein 5 [Zootermopsis nevadensis]|uniref:disks large-associated protein 5 n=1 Tax=Zootermopsis nevadensis TaxID=136037 RepID=UPI000B8E3948|nr:disks large-associated protein 5 [Zootermopsis nevadensis]